MVYKKYYFSIVVRIILLLITCLLLAYLIINTRIYYNILVVSGLIILQGYLLIRYFNKTNHLLERFFIYIKEGNNQTNFSNNLNKTPYKEFGTLADDIIKIISTSKIDEQYHYQYLNYIFEHIPIALITFNSLGKIELSNSAFCSQFQLIKPHHIDELNKLIPSISDKILNLEPGRQILEKFSLAGNIEYLSIKCSLFKIGQNEIKLVSFQSIKQELESSEVESWQKFTRILSHEIMNSVSPIISLSKHLKEQFAQKKDSISFRNENDYNQTVDSLKLIEERSLGLKDFITKYRNITQNIKPIHEQIDVLELAEEMALFFHETFKESNITYNFQIAPEDLTITADRKLITQVIINLIKNSIESLSNSDQGFIILRAFQDENKRTIIQIIDNGPGINIDELENIFIPFYTRKEGGSGIGLNFSRQIMNLHNGSIDVVSEPYRQTIFTLKF
ncbi:MAG: GHKL domain-containing protein [Bacteroidales bacterium]|nr:MAG: GHKL domain-containing protein [Bacteroidales bacterium]